MTTTARVWTRRRPGWSVISRKELTDHLLSIRFIALLVVLGLVAVATVYGAADQLRSVAPDASETAGVFLRLFTIKTDPIPFSFLSFVAFLGPILGIAFGFDAVNGERAQGTLPRLASQPIHRDDIINGKFVASLTVVGLIMAAMTVIIAGLGITMLGITPTSGEVGRLIVWLTVAIVYVGLWLAFSLLCSVVTRRAATAALVALAIWLVLALFGPLLAQVGADVVSPVDQANPQTALDNARLEITLSRVSPIQLFDDTSTALLNPEIRSTGIVTLAQVDRALVTELDLTESILLVWPYVVGLIAVTVALFAAAYVIFMRQEVRA
jgi:ABC-2 type transport system permease protein